MKCIFKLLREQQGQVKEKQTIKAANHAVFLCLMNACLRSGTIPIAYYEPINFPVGNKKALRLLVMA
jgi:hypothetical protein